MAKKKEPRTRDPIAADLRTPKYRKRVAKSEAERAEQKDAWSKKAKHKKVNLDESYDDSHWGHRIKVDTKTKEITSRETGHVLATYSLERETTWNGESNAHRDKLTSRILLQLGLGAPHPVTSWNEAADFLCPPKPTSLAEFYQVGDQLKILKGPLKDVLSKAERKEATVRDPHGPANTIGITIDGEFHLIDEEDVELLTEAFSYDDLTEWSMARTKAGISIPVSSEELEIIEMCKSKVYKKTLDEREKEVARKMVSRGVLNRYSDNDGIYFTSGVPKLTRS